MKIQDFIFHSDAGSRRLPAFLSRYAMTDRFTNTLYTSDNLYILNGMNSESVDLIYLDPPFNSKRIYSAPVGSRAAGASFKDMWTWRDVDEYQLEKMIDEYPHLVGYIKSVGGAHGKAMMSYVTYMTQRIIELHRVLKNTGSFYIHVDPTASHYIKIALDEIFGRQNFRNEIIWCYRGAGYPKRDFGKRHDVILRYSKSSAYTFNLDDVREPYAEATRERFKHHIGNVRKNTDYGVQTLHPKGKHPDDWWQIQPIAPSSKERTGYPTQKPLKLLERIIKASSRRGDVVMDPFCGCATTCVAAEHLGRKWIGIDIEEQAVNVLIDRLKDAEGLWREFIHTAKAPQRTDIRQEPPSLPVKKRLYQKQQGVCSGCKNEYLIKDLAIDHIIPASKGGGDYYSNYQLLCGNCNSIKGDRPMEYLNMKIRAIEKRRRQLSFGD